MEILENTILETNPDTMICMQSIEKFSPHATQHQGLGNYDNINMKIQDFSSRKQLLFSQNLTKSIVTV